MGAFINMPLDPHRRYSIGEVSEITGLPLHILRQWQRQFPQLNPKRDHANRRYYTVRDIDIVQRIKQLVRQEKMTLAGARLRLSQELHGEGRPQSNREAFELARKIEAEAREMLRLIHAFRGKS
jgi:DNA-binding transcriptional MerR regulator